MAWTAPTALWILKSSRVLPRVDCNGFISCNCSETEPAGPIAPSSLVCLLLLAGHPAFASPHAHYSAPISKPDCCTFTHISAMSASTHFMQTRSMAKKKKGTPHSTGLTGSDTAALIDSFSEEEYKPRPAPMYKPPPIQKPAPEVGKATQQKPASSGPFIFSFGRIWTGKPALDLLHGPDFPSNVGPVQARAIVTSIIEGLKKRSETHVSVQKLNSLAAGVNANIIRKSSRRVERWISSGYGLS